MPQQQSSQLSQKEGRIALAIQAFKRGQFKSLRAATKSYNVPYSTIRDRVNGHSSRCDSEPRNRKLTTIEESTLVQWILSMDQRGLSPRSDTVRQMANLLVEKRSDSSYSPVGKLWVYNFVRRHQALQTRYNRKYNYQRAKCEDPTIIRD
jgi:Tc5 transposase DNA-binding domain/helix-turn-helix, Psq domain